MTVEQAHKNIHRHRSDCRFDAATLVYGSPDIPECLDMTALRQLAAAEYARGREEGLRGHFPDLNDRELAMKAAKFAKHECESFPGTVPEVFVDTLAQAFAGQRTRGREECEKGHSTADHDHDNCGWCALDRKAVREAETARCAATHPALEAAAVERFKAELDTDIEGLVHETLAGYFKNVDDEGQVCDAIRAMLTGEGEPPKEPTDAD